MKKKYPTKILNREHPIFKRVKSDSQLVSNLSDYDLNRLYMARKTMRGDCRSGPSRNMHGKPFCWTKVEAKRVLRELTGRVPKERPYPSYSLPSFFGLIQS